MEPANFTNMSGAERGTATISSMLSDAIQSRVLPRILWLLFLALGLPAQLEAQLEAQSRVAFLGDFITAGQGVGVAPEDVAHATFPALAAHLLGPGFEVQGFGAHGHSLRTDAPNVYADSDRFAQALRFEPDIAVIMLGTNGSVVEVTEHDWRASLDRLLVPLRKANPGVRVLLASPPDIFPIASNVDYERREWPRARIPRLDGITQSLRRIAREIEDVEFVSVRGVLRSGHVRDGVHPTANNCLLYTSPSPRDQRGSRMPSSA